MQIAEELIRAGREVVLAVGRHMRMPRRYRGMDSFWWLEATGRLARTINEVPNIAAARRETSLQLIGRAEPQLRGCDLDLGALQARAEYVCWADSKMYWALWRHSDLIFATRLLKPIRECTASSMPLTDTSIRPA